MTASNKTLASPAIPSGVAAQEARLDPEMAAVLATLRANNAGYHCSRMHTHPNT